MHQSDTPLKELTLSDFKVKNLVPFYAELRENNPVAQVQDGKGGHVWVVSRYQDVHYTLSHPEAFSSKAISEIMHPEGIKEDCRRDLFVLSQDGREHKRNRGLMTKAFTSKVTKSLLPDIRGAAEKMVASIKRGEKISFIDRFAHPYVTAITDKVSGIEQTLSQKEMDTWLTVLGEVITGTPDKKRLASIEKIIQRQTNKFTKTIAQKKQCPGTDLISELIGAEVDGEKLSDVDLLNAVELIYVGGFHPQVQMLCRAMVQLSNNEGLFKALKASSEKVPAFVDELLRHQTLAPGTIRKTLQEVTFQGVTIPAGATVICLISSANRDPSVFPDPDTFDITRPNVKKHLAFGSGSHLCLGRALAKQQMITGLEAIIKNFDSITCLPIEEIEEHNTWMFRYIPNLSVIFS
ncbi:MAG: cytochrome P450 [Kordiimonadaceae bacterium]|nr:cytochrome P450 [Kordiimonadaceae bacterium]